MKIYQIAFVVAVLSAVVSLNEILDMSQLNIDSIEIENRRLENERWPRKYPIYARLIEDDKTGKIDDWVNVTEHEDADTRAINDAWTSLVVADNVDLVYRNEGFIVTISSLVVCVYSLIRQKQKLRSLIVFSPSKL